MRELLLLDLGHREALLMLMLPAGTELSGCTLI
jgi:hypothetical protein